MTILEMLDQLEAEIVSLRARNRELERARPAESKPARSRKPKGKKGTSRKANRKKTEVQLPLVAAEAAHEQPRAVGKRQALGRSIIQLRRQVAMAGHSENTR